MSISSPVNVQSDADVAGEQAKNLYVSSHESMQDQRVSVDTESSSTEASESEIVQDIRLEWNKARNVESEAVKGKFYHLSSHALLFSCLSSNLGLEDEVKRVSESEMVKGMFMCRY